MRRRPCRRRCAARRPRVRRPGCRRPRRARRRAGRPSCRNPAGARAAGPGGRAPSSGRGRHGDGWPAAAMTSWTESVPHTPQAELTSRAVGSASGGVARSTVTTLNSSSSVSVVVGAVPDGAHPVGGGHALVHEPARGELEVVPGRAHGDGDPLGRQAGSTHPDLQRLLGRDPVLVVEPAAVAPLRDPGAHRGPGAAGLRRSHTLTLGAVQTTGGGSGLVRQVGWAPAGSG